MENLAPILIGLIWLAFKYYQKNQKKQQEKQRRTVAASDSYSQSNEEVSNKTEKDFESYIEQFFGVPSNQPQPAFVSEVEADSYMDEGHAPNIDVDYESIEYQQSDSKNKERVKVQHMPTQKPDTKHPLIEDFDLKKAVIYNEILNPKYF